jgi:hypothetical protein
MKLRATYSAFTAAAALFAVLYAAPGAQAFTFQDQAGAGGGGFTGFDKPAASQRHRRCRASAAMVATTVGRQYHLQFGTPRCSASATIPQPVRPPMTGARLTRPSGSGTRTPFAASAGRAARTWLLVDAGDDLIRRAAHHRRAVVTPGGSAAMSRAAAASAHGPNSQDRMAPAIHCHTSVAHPWAASVPADRWLT